MYKIKWIAIEAGAFGEGTSTYSLEDATEIANHLNSLMIGICEYFVEKIK